MHQLHDRVNRIKQDKRLEVEYMTLLEIKERELQKGIKQGKIEVAKNLLDVLDDETISFKTGLPVLTIRQLREDANKLKK